jgi:RimJ/RimL family protein N-acetyltransferase
VTLAGADLAGWTPARRPDATPLAGARVRLEPLDVRRHTADLHAALDGPDPDPHLWDHLPYGPFADVAALRVHLEQQQGSADPRFFAIVDMATGGAGGVASLMRTDTANGVIEIGHVWFGAGLQRTPQATEAIFLMARHAFDDLGHRRLEWKCDAANARSQAAARRFGFTFEGVFRQHMIVKGRNRDTAWFSMLDGEWPAARAAFTAWLAPENFDAEGRQRRTLADLRQPAGGPAL